MSSDKRDQSTHGILPSLATSTSVRGYRLEIVDGTGTGTNWESTGKRCTIGFDSSCELVVKDLAVSRFHCELISDERRVRIRDLSSKNGTIVDGVRVNDAYLKRASMIQIGRSKVRFRLLDGNAQIPLSSNLNFGSLIGQSIAMRRMFAVLERAARSNVTILLEGETGTGKSAAARSIHLESTRKDEPFIVIDCSALPATLLDSELFGHEKGSFTGALTRRIGAFEEADQGTVFLDELGELPLELQAKLLSVLENRQIRRIGSNQTRPIDVRVIAATNRDLRSEVNVGRFREDLYYRFSVVEVQVPPLRHRMDDIQPLVENLLQRLHVPPEQIATMVTPAFIQRLRGSAWPGNIRELRNHLERHLLFYDFEDNEPAHEREGTPVDDIRSGMPVDTSLPFTEARQQALTAFERHYISELLQDHDGKVSQAAAHAGITRTYLYRLMQRHRLRSG